MKIRNAFIICLLLLVYLLSGCEENQSTNPPDKTPSSELTQSESEFDYEIENDSAKITKYLNKTQIVVPEQIAGKPVKIIGDNAFYQQTDVVSIVLPQSLTTIEHSAFYRCYSLTEISIPENVNQVDPGAFFRCSSLTKISVDPENAYYADIDGVLFNKEKTELLAYPEGSTVESYTIPDTVRSLAKSSFGYYCRNLKKLTIPSSVITLPDYNIFIYPADITLAVESGSAAEQYAKEQKMKYEIYN